MNPLTVGIIGLVALIILLLSGMPLGYVMALIGALGFAYLRGLDNGLALLGIVPARTFGDYGLAVIPLFTLMGQICFSAGLSKDLYNTAYKWMGNFGGGLSIASIGACAGFSAICGSSVATAVTLGSVCLPEMKRFKYDSSLATGCIATGGTLGIMIPPSLGFIIYGIITEQSIGKLFLAGIFPGILQALFLIITITILCKRNPLLGSPGGKTGLKEKIISLKNTWIVLLLFLLIMGGLYLGIFSPTETAGVGAFGAFAFALATKRLSWKSFREALIVTLRTSSMAIIIVVGALIFGYFLAITRVPTTLASLIQGLQVNAYVSLSIILLVYLFLGCIMDTIAMTLLTVPIFYPLILSYGFDPIWFGVIVVLMGEMGLITPPVGINVFVLQGIVRDVPMYTIFRGILPFFCSLLVLAVVLVAFPQISLFLPNNMR